MVCLGNDRAAAPVLPNKMPAAAAPPTAPRHAALPGRHGAVHGAPSRGVAVNLEGEGIQPLKNPSSDVLCSKVGDVMIWFQKETIIICVYMLFFLVSGKFQGGFIFSNQKNAIKNQPGR